MSDIACPLCVGVLDDECTECFGRGVISGPKQLGSTSKDAEFYGYTDLPGEIWKPIPEYEHYHVSSEGRVVNTESGRLMRLSVTTQGQKILKVYKSNKQDGFALHRLVAKFFMENYEPSQVVKFHDGDPANCAVNNMYQDGKLARGRIRN